MVEPELVAEEKKNLYQIILDRQDEVSQIKLDQQDYFPEKLFVYQLVMAFGHASANDLPKAIEYINKSEECLADIKEKSVPKCKQFNNLNTCVCTSIVTTFHLLKL